MKFRIFYIMVAIGMLTVIVLTASHFKGQPDISTDLEDRMSDNLELSLELEVLDDDRVYVLPESGEAVEVGVRVTITNGTGPFDFAVLWPDAFRASLTGQDQRFFRFSRKARSDTGGEFLPIRAKVKDATGNEVFAEVPIRIDRSES